MWSSEAYSNAAPYASPTASSRSMALSFELRRDEFRAPVRGPDRGDAAGVERQRVGLHAVGEDDAVVRHQRLEAQLLARLHEARRQVHVRRLAQKRLAHHE